MMELIFIGSYELRNVSPVSSDNKSYLMVSFKKPVMKITTGKGRKKNTQNSPAPCVTSSSNLLFLPVTLCPCAMPGVSSLLGLVPCILPQSHGKHPWLADGVSVRCDLDSKLLLGMRKW